jgi:protein involved in temperature-dependent protein secretion
MYLTNNTIEIRAETDEEAEKLHEIKTRLEETRPNDRLGKLTRVEWVDDEETILYTTGQLRILLGEEGMIELMDLKPQ